MSGYTGTEFELLYSLNLPVTRASLTANTTTVITATTAMIPPRCIIPAGYFTVRGQSFAVRMRGTFALSATTTTSFVVGLDPSPPALGKSLAVSGAFFSASGTYTWDIDLDVTASQAGQGATTLQCNGAMRIGPANTFLVQANPGALCLFSNAITGIDCEVQQYLELWANTSTSAAGTGYTVQQFRVYGEN